MHNIKEIRKDFDAFSKALKKRSIDIDLNKLKKLDIDNRDLIQKKETLEKEKKDISKTKDKALFSRSKEITQSIDKITDQQSKIKSDLDEILSSIPNIPHDDVPIGSNENENVELTKSGQIPNFEFTPKSHYELGEKLGMLDFDLATKTTGSRFVFVKNKLALLERAISNFMLDIHTSKNGYEEISPPLLASENTMFGTGQLPKFENDQFEVKLEEGSGRKFLIPTAEVILTNIVKDKILDLKTLPMRFVASTPCFRKEAGSYGKDTKGLIRQHQFDKVELVKICHPDNSEDEHEKLIEDASKILELLELPFRKVILSSGDTGFSASKTVDLEVWFPSQNTYREISSCSNFTDFQSRRANLKFKSDKGNEYCHTLNGSGLAIGRTLAAILENYQTEGENFIYPEVLKKYI